MYRNFDHCRGEYRKLNAHYTNQYRGGYLLNYTLAVTAAGLAVLSLLFLYFNAKYVGDSDQHIINFVVFGMGALKLLILLLILINTQQANGIDFNQRTIVSRYIMEQIRCMTYLALFDIRRFPGSQNPTRKLKNNFTAGFLQDRIRVVFKQLDGQRNVPFETDYNQRLPAILRFIQEDWVQQQISYHEQKKETQEALNKKLERIINRLTLFVLYIVGLDVLLGMAGHFAWLPHSFNHWLHDLGTPFILACAAVIPACVAAYNGLKFQTEARKLGERSASMAELLKSLDNQYKDLLDRIAISKDSPANPGSFTSEASTLVNDTARIMIDEVTEWMFVYTREVPDA
jgi:predicted membrane channel-forming protein YqfA (hemolysin III family)